MSQHDTLTLINLDDLVSSFGWEKSSFLASIVRHAFVRPARKFADQMVDFDKRVGKTGLAEASRNIMQNLYVRDVRVHGCEHIPPNGPVLFLSNHPGMADTISLFTAINRTDLKIIALHRPFLESLTNTTSQLFFIGRSRQTHERCEGTGQQSLAKRRVRTHLPRRGVEPDPLVYPGALDSLNKWIDSAGVFIRFAKETKIVPILVSGVIWEQAAHQRMTRLKRTRREREKLAAALQLLAMITRNAKPRAMRKLATDWSLVAFNRKASLLIRHFSNKRSHPSMTGCTVSTPAP